jgi:hypothetical protein
MELSIPSRKKRKTTSAKAKNAANSSTREIELPDDIPPRLQQLDVVFQSLNTVHTFMSVQRQIPLTLEILKTSIEGLCGKELRTRDVVEMSLIAPSMIQLNWVPGDELEDGIIKQLKPSCASSNDNSNVKLVIEFKDVRSSKPKRNPMSLLNETSPSRSRKSAKITDLISKRNLLFRELLVQFHEKCKLSVCLFC